MNIDIEPIGIIKLSIDSEDVVVRFKGSQDAFKSFAINLLNPIIKKDINYCFKVATYFDKGLSEEELIKLTEL